MSIDFTQIALGLEDDEFRTAGQAKGHRHARNLRGLQRIFAHTARSRPNLTARAKSREAGASYHSPRQAALPTLAQGDGSIRPWVLWTAYPLGCCRHCRAVLPTP